jgi:hypothetical protein
VDTLRLLIVGGLTLVAMLALALSGLLLITTK